MKNISPQLYTLSAVAVGFILTEDNNADRQNAIGNWLMLVSQLICTNAYFVAFRDSNKSSFNGVSDDDTIDMLYKMKDALEKEIDELKKKM